MKKIALYSVLALFLTACDAPNVAKVDLKEGKQITFNNIKTTKSYTATKDDQDRQLHFFETSTDLNTTYQDFNKTFETNGYKANVRTQNESLIQVYYKKPNAALIVANFKQIQPKEGAASQAVISWQLN
ncbi:hypothetical protein [Pseudomonas sp. SIMBA_068]|jgi:hypothetical protein|uniref:hypothetical protein n=1 Tax=Pseudomonas sp. SIMBA_068 TaxID=3085808 RepID=UPI0039789903